MNERSRQPAPKPAANPPAPGGEIVLGRLGGGPADSSLEPGGLSQAPGPFAGPAAEPAELTLPPGGWVALRISGGLRFSSRQVVIMADGRLTAERDRLLRPAAPPLAAWRLTGAEQAALRRLITASSLSRLRSTTSPSPDGLSYELAVRGQRGQHRLIFDQPRLPRPVQPLIRFLRQILNEG